MKNKLTLEQRVAKLEAILHKTIFTFTIHSTIDPDYEYE